MAYDVDDYDPSTALTAYYPTRAGRVPARIWAVEKLAHDLAELGLIEMFEGAGTNPTSLTGYAADKIWLQVQSGVTEEPGVLRIYDGVGSASDIANWPAVTVDSFRSYLSFGQVEYAGVWNASTNSPTLVSGGGVAGNYYVVSVAGSTTLDAVSSWSVGDWAIFNGTAWQKVAMSAAGPLQVSDGSAASPGLSFVADTDTGLYRKGSNNPAIAVNGAEVQEWTTAGTAITGNISATGNASVTGNATVGGNATITGTTTTAGLTVSGAVSLPAGSLETADLAASAVTLAKQANGTANRLQGFNGSGAPSEVTIGAGLSLSGAALSNTASSFLLSTVTVTNEDDLPFTSGISSTYDEYELHLVNVYPATNATVLYFQVSTDGGSTFKNTSYIASVASWNSGAGSGFDAVTVGIPLTLVTAGQISNSSTGGFCGVVRFWPNGSSTKKQVHVAGSYMLTGASSIGVVHAAGAWNGGNDAVNAFRIVSSSGNVTGTARLIGIKNS